MRRFLLAVFAVLLAAGCTSGSDAVSTGGDFQFVAPDGKTKIFYPRADRQKAPAIAGESLMRPGKRISTADYAGKIVVINIWGAWCGPCRAEAPELDELHRERRDAGVRVLGIDVRDNRSAAQDFVRNHQLSYPSIFDYPGRSLLGLKGYPRNAVPSTIVLDRQGRVAWISLDSLLKSDLEPIVRRLSQEP